MRIPILIGLTAFLIGAQSAPPRKDIPGIAKTANGAIVSIVMSDKDGHAIAQGSGFLVSNDGRVLTNYHVIKNGSSAIVKLPDGAFFAVDGVLATDKARDIAVIKAHGENFRTVTLGDSDGLQVGEEVVAIGNPLSLESTVSNGIVSGIRTVKEEGGKFLQITAPISPGSSGGPLFNMAGEVVGITTLHLEGGENLNFAIPVNEARPLLLARFSKVSGFPNEPESSSQTAQVQGSVDDLQTTLHWMEIISENDGWRPSTLSRDLGALYVRERNTISSVDGCSVTTTDKWFVLKNPSNLLDDDTVLDNTTSATFNLADIDPSRIHIQPTHIDKFPVWAVSFSRSDDTDRIQETRQWGSARRTNFIRTVGLIFSDEESATRFVRAIKHAVELCGGKGAPF
jgi:V8-like Glu-specific endopeptidase